MDLRGHGDSDTGFSRHDAAAVGSDVLALVGHLGGGPAVVVGNSLGAAGAGWAAAETPALVAGIVLLGPFVRDLPTSVTGRIMTRVMLRRPWGFAATAAYYRSLNKGRAPADLDAHVAQIRAALRRPGRWKQFLATTRVSHAVVEKRWSDVSAPTLVVMGDLDPDLPDPAAEARLAADLVAGPAQVLMVPEAGHYPAVAAAGRRYPGGGGVRGEGPRRCLERA